VSTSPPTPEFRSQQYEFTSEQNKTINELAGAMSVVGTFAFVLGIVYLIAFVGVLIQVIQGKGDVGVTIVAAVSALIYLAVGSWTRNAAFEFRRIVETTNRDIYHLMNALESLTKLYSLLRLLIMAGLAILALGVAVMLYNGYLKG
jgi:hypothetical protein